MKKYVLTTIILILVPLIIFLPLLGLLIYTVNGNQKDYVADALGTWNAYQYYYERERFVCNEEDYMSLTLTEDSIKIEGTVIAETEQNYTKQGGATIVYENEGITYTLILSFEVNNNLKIVVDGTTYSIFLRRA